MKKRSATLIKEDNGSDEDCRPWTAEEDARLTQLVGEHGDDLQYIAGQMSHRNNKQVCDRVKLMRVQNLLQPEEPSAMMEIDSNYEPKIDSLSELADEEPSDVDQASQELSQGSDQQMEQQSIEDSKEAEVNRQTSKVTRPETQHNEERPIMSALDQPQYVQFPTLPRAVSEITVPSIKQDSSHPFKWTEQQDLQFFELVRLYGKDQATLALHMNKPELAIRNKINKIRKDKPKYVRENHSDVSKILSGKDEHRVASEKVTQRQSLKQYSEPQTEACFQYNQIALKPLTNIELESYLNIGKTYKGFEQIVGNMVTMLNNCYGSIRQILQNSGKQVQSKEIVKAPWSKRKRDLLVKLIRKYGRNFDKIATYFPQKTLQQVRAKAQSMTQNPSQLDEKDLDILERFKKDRYKSNQLWPDESIRQLVRLFIVHGPKYRRIQRKMPQYTKEQIYTQVLNMRRPKREDRYENVQQLIYAIRSSKIGQKPGQVKHRHSSSEESEEIYEAQQRLLREKGWVWKEQVRVRCEWRAFF